MIRRILTWYPRHRLAMRLLVALYSDPSTISMTRNAIQDHARKASDLFYGVTK